jgi:endonuclease-3
MKAESVQALLGALQAANPQPRSELVHTSAFELLAAVMLSAQATDVSVNKASAGLFALAPTPLAMLTLGEERVIAHIRSIGLYRTKARNLVATSRILAQQHAGQVPRTREALEALPGVGRKTANVVLNVAFGEPLCAVDTHVFRVANRTGLASGRTPDQVETELARRIPPQFRLHAHHWLLLHGRYVCKARQPDCTCCAVSTWCGKHGVVKERAAPGGGKGLPPLPKWVESTRQRPIVDSWGS